MSVFRPFCKVEYVRRKSVIIYMKYFTTSWSLETLITHFFVSTICAKFEKLHNRYYETCPWIFSSHWARTKVWQSPLSLTLTMAWQIILNTSRIILSITYTRNWLIDCVSTGDQVFVQCAYPSLMYSYVLSGTYCIYYAHAHVTWYLGIFACWHKVSLVAAIF